MAEEKQQPKREQQKEEQYVCDTCGKTYGMSEARRKELACCGQPLTRTEVATKSTPTPFGP